MEPVGPDDEELQRQRKLRHEINAKNVFIQTNKHLFGYPFIIGSGVARRTEAGHKLDWALICGMPLDRRGRNMVP